MSRLTIAALCAALLASACKVERTPQEFIDHRRPISELRVAAAEELQDRLLATGQALSRGDAAEAMRALSPAADAVLLPVGEAATRVGEAQIAGALGEIATGGDAVRLRDVEVSVGPGADIAWFRAWLDHPDAAAGAPVRITGVYLRGDEGEWQLVQAHLSTITPPADSLQPSPAVDASPPAGG